MVKDAPGNHINGGWEGDIRSIKWKDQEGDVHDGCKGTLPSTSIKRRAMFNS